MPDLFFPQLRTGAIAHYPIRKTAATRTVLNVLPSGSLLMYSDDAARKANWNWDYSGLTMDEVAVLQDFFVTCNGPLRSFTFLDPTGNLLSASSDFTAAEWQVSSGLKINGEVPCPISNVAAVGLVNTSQAIQEIAQALNIPSNFQYCFSIYLSSPAPGSVTLFRRGPYSEEAVSFQIGPDWKRIWTSGNLLDQSTGLTVGIKVAPGQQVALCAAQLQAQPGMAAYVNRPQTGDVYPNAHWALNELRVRHLGPSNINVSVSIEA